MLIRFFTAFSYSASSITLNSRCHNVTCIGSGAASSYIISTPTSSATCTAAGAS